MNSKAREKSQVTDTPSQDHILSPVLLPGETSYSPFLTRRPQQNCSRATAGSWSSSEMLLSCVRAVQISSTSCDPHSPSQKIPWLEVTGEVRETEVQGSQKQLCCVRAGFSFLWQGSVANGRSDKPEQKPSHLPAALLRNNSESISVL